MGKKKSIQSAMKSPTKLEKKPQNQTLMKILRPKVFITDSSNFKTLVQELTGNGNSPPRMSSAAASPPPPTAAYHDVYGSSFDSSTEGSPDLRGSVELGFDFDFDFSSQIRDLESLLMGMDSMNYSDSCSAPVNFQQEICAFDCDYDFSSLI